jgi:hypothetical protein
MKTISLQLVFLLLFTALCTTALRAQESDDEKPADLDKSKQEAVAPVPAAPVPAQIITAKKVFIANAGLDSYSMDLFKRAGEPDGPYNRFYAAMKSWNHYELVSSPAEADLVFEVRFTTQLAGCGGSGTIRDAQMGLSILDSKTHFLLWTVGEPVERAFRKVTFQKNVGQSIANIVEHMKKLALQPVMVAESKR